MPLSAITARCHTRPARCHKPATALADGGLRLLARQGERAGVRRQSLPRVSAAFSAARQSQRTMPAASCRHPPPRRAAGRPARFGGAAAPRSCRCSLSLRRACPCRDGKKLRLDASVDEVYEMGPTLGEGGGCWRRSAPAAACVLAAALCGAAGGSSPWAQPVLAIELRSSLVGQVWTHCCRAAAVACPGGVCRLVSGRVGDTVAKQHACRALPQPSHPDSSSTLPGFSKVKLVTQRATGKQYACKVIPLPRPGKKVNEHLSDRGAIMKVGRWLGPGGACGAQTAASAARDVCRVCAWVCAGGGRAQGRKKSKAASGRRRRAPRRLLTCTLLARPPTLPPQEIDALLDLEHPNVVSRRPSCCRAGGPHTENRRGAAGCRKPEGDGSRAAAGRAPSSSLLPVVVRVGRAGGVLC